MPLSIILYIYYTAGCSHPCRRAAHCIGRTTQEVSYYSSIFIDALNSLLHRSCSLQSLYMHVTVQCIIYFITRVLLKSNHSLYFADTRSNSDLEYYYTLAATAQIQMHSTDALFILLILYNFSAAVHYNKIIYLHLNTSLFDCASVLAYLSLS